MRLLYATSIIFFLAAACGPTATEPPAAQAQTSANAAQVTAAEQTAILRAAGLTANGSGQVMNECNELVAPQFIVTDVGGGVGRAVALVMGGGPNMASCYGDGPLVRLMRDTGGAWREIYQNRGGPMVILSTQHNGANDLADGGPGFSFPVWEWNGAEYASANRESATARSATRASCLNRRGRAAASTPRLDAAPPRA